MPRNISVTDFKKPRNISLTDFTMLFLLICLSLAFSMLFMSAFMCICIVVSGLGYTDCFWQRYAYASTLPISMYFYMRLKTLGNSIS